MQLREELGDAVARLRELEAAGVDELVERARRAEEDSARMRADGDRLLREKEAAEEGLQRAQEQAQGVERELREARAARAEALEAMQSMQMRVQSAEFSLGRERQRVADEKAAGNRALTDKAKHGADLAKFASENMELREEVRGLHEDVESYREAMADYRAGKMGSL